jgi:hypothetical protein
LRGGGTIAEAQAPSANSAIMPVDLVTNALIREYKSRKLLLPASINTIAARLGIHHWV